MLPVWAALVAVGYVELVPTRSPFLGSKAPVPRSWPRFPAEDARQAVAVQGDIFWVVAEGGRAGKHAKCGSTCSSGS